MTPFKSLVLTTTWLTLSACGGASTEPATPPPPPPAPPAATASVAPSAETPAPSAKPAEAPVGQPPTEAPAVAHDVWSEGMTKDQQVAFMKKNVVPEMEPVFKAANAKRYAEFGCKTCHGPKFKDPKEFLPKLTFKDGKISAFTDKPEIAKFMAEQVVPHMATALGLKPFDMTTHTGFGCNGCHTVLTK